MNDEPTNDPAGNDGDGLLQEVFDNGRRLAEQTWSGGSWSSVYEYRGRFFSVDEEEVVDFADAREAFVRAGIGRDTYDGIDYLWVAAGYEHLVREDDEGP